MTEVEGNSSRTVPIDLRLPPDPAMSKVLRLAASGVASLCGFTIREIDEIKLAVSEVLIALIEHGAGEPVEISFRVSMQEFQVLGSTRMGPEFDLDHPDLALCRVVLEGVCTEHRLDVDGDVVRITATLCRPFPGA
ncbi:MAG: hypothetical protein ABMA25_20780 [Ilumatobacteraceae bacterium]